MISAGIPRKSGQTREQMFEANSVILKEMAEVTADVCPNALVGIITNPVDAVVPLFCGVLKKKGKFDARKVFGISTVDIVRTNTFVAEMKKLNPMDVKVPVIGGHSDNTIVPLLSQCSPKVDFTKDAQINLIQRIQQAGSEV